MIQTDFACSRQRRVGRRHHDGQVDLFRTGLILRRLAVGVELHQNPKVATTQMTQIVVSDHDDDHSHLKRDRYTTPNNNSSIGPVYY